MARKSAAAASAVNPIEIQRPDPPADLTEDECEVWTATVNRMPADWFGAETFPLLTQYCRHVVQSSRIAKMIHREEDRISRALGRVKNPIAVDVGLLDSLLNMQKRESQSMAMLAGKMKISQSATINASSKRKPSTTANPWDFSGPSLAVASQRRLD